MTGTVANSVLSTVLFGKETSYGSGGTANKDIGLVKNLTVNPDSTAQEAHGFGQAKAVYVKAGIVNVKGSMEFDWQHGRPFEWLWFGGTTTHANTSGDWTHTFVWSESMPSLASEFSYDEVGTTDVVGAYTGLIFGNSSLSCNFDGMANFKTDFVGKTINNSGSSVTAAVVNSGAPLAGFEAGLSMGGSSVAFVQNWELTLNRNSKVIHSVGQRAPAYGMSHLANVSWKATIGLEDTTQLNRLLGSSSTITATEPASFTNIFSATNGVTLGSGQRAFTMTVTGCQVKDYSINAKLNDFVLYDISGSGILTSGTCVDQVSSSNW